MKQDKPHHEGWSDALGELLDEARTGDVASQYRFVLEAHRRLKPMLRTILDNSDEADDIFQEILLRAMNPRSPFVNRGTTFSWLMCIARSIVSKRPPPNRTACDGDHCLDGLSARASETDPAAQLASAEDLPELTAAIQHAMEFLPAPLQETLTLRWRDQMIATQIAKVLHITATAVRKRLKKATVSMIRFLKRNHPDLYSAHKRYFEQILQKLEDGNE
jgi:RNA polymerase sigma factor (sigma-70 family)